MSYKRLSEIEAVPVVRASTSFEELDFIYGYSEYQGQWMWGMPKGKISLWAGTSGIGKSRLAIDVAKNCSLRGEVLYFQTESSLEDFAGWTKDSSLYPNLYCSSDNKIDDITKTILQVKPKLVIIDSVNEVAEFVNGNKQEARRIIHGLEPETLQDSPWVIFHNGLKHAADFVGCHIILLGQLNQDGTIKGGTSLPHLVDIHFELKPYSGCKNIFAVSVGIKHRYGRRDDSIYGAWQHKEDGVKCVTDNRLSDEKWCESNGLQYMNRGERMSYLLHQDEEYVALCNNVGQNEYVAPKENKFKSFVRYLFTPQE